MKRGIRIGLIGDYDPRIRAHNCIPSALKLAGDAVECVVTLTWIATTAAEDFAQRERLGCRGLWCVPGSPYVNMNGALRAIRFAREKRIPFLGTCGGFQHAAIEYARNVLAMVQADHAESNPQTELPLIAPLSCSLVGACGIVRFRPGSRAARIYGSDNAMEEYHCNFGLNPGFQSKLNDGRFAITGTDEKGAARVFELKDHPFFLATLFQPELSAFSGKAHPLVVAFVGAAAIAAG